MTALDTEPNPPTTVAKGGRKSACEAPGGDDRTDWVSAIPFFAVHLAPFAAFFVAVTWEDWVLCGVLYAVRMFFITAGYHRYFSHRSYRMNRFFQFLMAFGGTTAVQKGPLWWAGHHRIHHRYTDLDGDVHSPRDGVWWSHVGWILSTKYKETGPDDIRDFARYPELRFLDRSCWIGPWLLAVACLAIGGWGGLVIGFFLSTVLLWHGTFLVNSMAHIVGRRRYATPDTSRNSLFVALVTGGEGWHNNHHYLPSSIRQGFRWWEIDPTWYALRALAAVHVVTDLKNPPARLLDQARVRDGAFDIGMFRSYWERAAKLAGERAGGVGFEPAPIDTTDALSGSPALPNIAAADARQAADALPGALALPVAEQPSDVSVNASALQGLIARALESADQLARSTRRTKATASAAPRGGPTPPS